METCFQCGKPILGPCAKVNHDRPDAALYHYDCLPFSLRDTHPFVAEAVALAESGVRDADLAEHYAKLIDESDGE